ncbi:MAG TPA: TonB family protein [Polyangiaceae bacterium]|jgi:TonB family protein
MGRLRFLVLHTALWLFASGVARAQTAPQAPVAVEAPVVLTHVDAVYPPAALPEKKHADVVLLVTVDLDGHVSKIDVATSGGDLLDQAAIVATRQWTFVPAKRGGVPVASRIRIPFHFAPPAPPPELVEPPPSPEPALDAQAAVPAAPSAPVAPTAPNAAAPAAPIEIDVIGQATPPTHGPSDFRVKVGQLAVVPRQNASELLKLAPGILLTNEGGEGHAEQVFLRGFDAREGQDIEFTVGGVPINESGNLHGNGYADTHFIIPEFVEGFRVIEGPFDPRQGNYAVAGSADYELGLERRGLFAKYTNGSFGTHRLLLGWGPKSESAHTFGGAEIYQTDGYGQNRDAQRASAMAQYEGRLGERGSYRVTSQAYTTHFHSAGLIRDDDFRAGRIGFYDSYDHSSFAREQIPEGGDSSRYSLAAAFETHADDTTLNQQVFLIRRDMRLLENFTGFLLDVQEPLQSVHAQRGDMLDLNVRELTLGARGSARFTGSLFGKKQELELGYFARGDQVSSTQQRLEANTGVPYKTDTDLDSTLGEVGLYADANVRPLSWVTLRGGVRAELLTYDVLDNCAAQSVSRPSTTNPPIDQSCLTQQNFGRPREADQRDSTSSVALLPRASLMLGPAGGFSFLASYGRGMRSVDPGYITEDVKTPFASIAAYEGGVLYSLTSDRVALVARSVFFQTHVDKDLIFNESEGRNVLGAGTTRTGWLGAARATGSFFDESFNLTLVRSSYDDTHLLVAYVPAVVLRSDTALFSNLPLAFLDKRVRGTVGAGVTYVGPRPLPYGERSQDLFTVDASASLTWHYFELGLSATNLFNRRYRLGEYNFASDFHSQPQPTLVPERMFSAGPPRSLFATLGVYLGGV